MEDLGELLARAALEGHKGNMRVDAFERAHLPDALNATWSAARDGVLGEANRGQTDLRFEFKSNTRRFCPTIEDVVAALPLEIWKMRNEAKSGNAVHVHKLAHNHFEILLSVTKRARQLIHEHNATDEANPAPKRRKPYAPPCPPNGGGGRTRASPISRGPGPAGGGK